MMATEQECASMQYQIDQYCDRAHVASQQLVHINNQISALTVRCNRAAAMARKPLSYNYRLRLNVLENLRNKIYQYMCDQARKMQQLEDQVIVDTECHL